MVGLCDVVFYGVVKGKGKLWEGEVKGRGGQNSSAAYYFGLSA